MYNVDAATGSKPKFPLISWAPDIHHDSTDMDGDHALLNAHPQHMAPEKMIGILIVYTGNV